VRVTKKMQDADFEIEKVKYGETGFDFSEVEENTFLFLPSKMVMYSDVFILHDFYANGKW